MNDARITVGSYTHAGNRGKQPHYWCAVCGYDTDSEQTIGRHVQRSHPGIPEVLPKQVAEQREEELHEHTVNELTTKAESLGVTLSSGMRKQEIIDAIQTTESLGEPDTDED